MSRVVLLFGVLFLVFVSSCTNNSSEKGGGKTEKEIHMDSLSVAEVITENFDTTGVPLYYVPEEYTELSEKKIYSDSKGDISVTMVKYCQTKEGGIEVNYQLKSGGKFRIVYRDWAGRILVSKGDSIINNYSFDKKDYLHLKDEAFWNDKVLQDLNLIKMNINDESVIAQFYVASPSDEAKADLEGVAFKIELDSSGNVELTEIP